ncbi:MAG: hypothetical protein GC138_01710 [Gammaproteobacteria bacterium]|nr:hypothetical protein [Gammaproteobacteria bacterium]
MVLDVIRLHHRSAAEVEPLIRDFVDKDGTLKAADFQLIVRTSVGNLKELRDLIAILDTPQRRLLVKVKQLSGDGAQQSDREDTRSIWRTGDGDDDRVQQIRVLEDQEAFIDVGREIPIVDFAVAQSQSGTIMEQKTRYVGTTTGFYVRVHLDGDRVRAEIFPHQKMRSGGLSSPPEFNAQTLHTTVSGNLGRWITIGASGDREHSPDVIEYSASAPNSPARRILLQVRLDKP